jgi:hypothetical protein
VHWIFRVRHLSRHKDSGLDRTVTIDEVVRHYEKRIVLFLSLSGLSSFLFYGQDVDSRLSLRGSFFKGRYISLS